MAKKCEHQLPTARIRIHSPRTIWHPHKDTTFTVKEETDFGLWAAMLKDGLINMGYTGSAFTPFQLGFFLTAMNSLPEDVRRALAHGILRGLGPVVTEEEEGIRFELKQLYDPLVGERETPSGLILPGNEIAGTIILPGTKEFQEVTSG